MSQEIAVIETIRQEADQFRKALEAFGLEHRPESPMQFVDQIEAAMEENGVKIDFKVKHMLTAGLYVRTIEMPAGSFLTSQIHKTNHPFMIHTGDISVWTAEEGVILMHAPYLGVTEPGTRRVLFAHTDTVWSTFHPTDKTDLEEIRKDLIMEHTNPIIEGRDGK